MVLAATVLVMAGCGSSPTAIRATTTTKERTAATTTVPPVPECSVGALRIEGPWASPPGSTGASQYFLTFENASSSTCTLYGFPGVSFLDSHGNQIGSPAQRGTASTPELVRLTSDEQGYATLSVANPKVAPCAGPGTVVQVRIYPPASYVAAYVTPPYLLSVCTSTNAANYVDTTIGPVTSGTAPGDYGVLQAFSPETVTTWWSVVESNLTFGAYVTRTTDSGMKWQTVMTADHGISASNFLNTDTAWVAPTPASAGPATLYRTDNGGGSWQRIGSLPTACELQFVNLDDGWCTEITGAAGSEPVALYRTTDSGANWALTSSTNVPGEEASSSDALPFGCDKAITFTSPTAGWANSFCNGGSPWMYASTDAGAQWFPLASVPVPAGAPAWEGGGLSPPAVSGTHLATAMNIQGQPGTTAIATSSDSGQTWQSQLVPNPTRGWNVDLIDPSHWVLTNGTVMMASDNAGTTWRTWTPSVAMKASGPYGQTVTLDFLTPQLGWAEPSPNGGPFWWTTDGGTMWKAVTVTAGPYVLDSSR